MTRPRRKTERAFVRAAKESATGRPDGLGGRAAVLRAIRDLAAEKRRGSLTEIRYRLTVTLGRDASLDAVWRQLQAAVRDGHLAENRYMLSSRGVLCTWELTDAGAAALEAA